MNDTVLLRYIVDDVDTALAFYTAHLGFDVVMHPAPTFAMLSRGALRVALSAPSRQGGGGQAMPDGRVPEPGGWNRMSLPVDDLDAEVDRLRSVGASFRNDIITGVGGKQILLDDPAGNPVELFELSRPEAHLDDVRDTRDRAGAYCMRPIGWVESTLVDPSDAPNQGEQGAPDAWLVINHDVLEGIRDLRTDSEILVLTWMHRAPRDELVTQPGDDPTGPQRGVFSTRSPARPNPIGLHRVSVVACEPGRVRVRPLEAVDGTPLVDIKPVLQPPER